MKTTDSFKRLGVEVIFDHRPVAIGKGLTVGRDEPLPDFMAVWIGLAVEWIHVTSV